MGDSNMGQGGGRFNLGSCERRPLKSEVETREGVRQTTCKELKGKEPCKGNNMGNRPELTELVCE